MLQAWRPEIVDEGRISSQVSWDACEVRRSTLCIHARGIIQMHRQSTLWSREEAVAANSAAACHSSRGIVRAQTLTEHSIQSILYVPGLHPVTQQLHCANLTNNSRK